MTPAVRKFLLTTHVTFSVGWLGLTAYGRAKALGAQRRPSAAASGRCSRPSS
jgi:hypothetical protein